MQPRTILPAGITSLATAAVTLGLATILAVAGPAAAQTPPAGTLTLTPASGRNVDVPSVVTSGPCPAAANAFNIRLQGPGGLDSFATTWTTAGFSTTAPISARFGLSFSDTAATDTPPIVLTAGTYTVTLQCVSGLGSTIQGTFVTKVIFSSPTSYTVHGGTGSDGQEARTGAPVAVLVGFGLAVTSVGIGLLLVARRRRAA